jgi:hypothetical protein
MKKLSCAGYGCAGITSAIVILFLICAGGMFIHPDPGTVAIAAVCFVAVTLGCHWFGRWLWGNLQPESPPWRWRWTARVVAVVVFLFVAGTAAVGIVHQSLWLATSKERLIENPMRINDRFGSADNMKKMGVAAYDHTDKTTFLPTSTFTPDGRPMHSWQTALLPYLEQNDLYSQFYLSKPWDHPDNRRAINTPVKTFLYPGIEPFETSSGLPASHYSANVLTIGGNRPRRFSDFVDKGTENTILFGEAVSNPRAWADPLNWRDPRLPLGHPYGFGGPLGKTQFAFADGSVRTVDPQELADLLK